MTLPSYVASSNQNSTAGTTASTRAINRPAAWTSGRLAIVAIWRGTNEAFTTTPSGFQQVTGSPFRIGTTSDYVSVFWKILGGSEPASYTWTWTTSVYCEIVGACWQDTDQSNPFNQVAGQSNSSSTTITCPAVTPSVSNTLLVCIGGYDNDTSYTAGTGMTERLDFGGWAITFADETGPASGVSSGTNTFTASGGAFASVGITLALQEVQAAGTTTLTPDPVTVPLVAAAPTVALTLTLAPDAVTVPIATATPSVALTYTLSPDAVAVSLLTAAPTLIHTFTLTPDAVAIPLVVLAPSVDAGGGAPTTLTPDPVLVPILTTAPIVELTYTLAPSPVTLPIVTATPTVALSYALAPSPVTVALVAVTPLIGRLYTVAPLPVAVTIAAPTPTIVGGQQGVIPRAPLRVPARAFGLDVPARGVGLRVPED